MVDDYASLIERGVIDLAVLQNKVVGYVVHFSDGNSMQLANVAVLPSVAGFGYGKKLLDHVESRAIALGLDAIELCTNEAMTENQAYYPRQGYQEIKREEQDGFRRIFYRKTLS